MICIKNGTIHTAVDPQPFTGDILIGGGKILKIASHIDDDYEQLIEAAGLNIYPGFVEAHCHTGLDGYGMVCQDRIPTNGMTLWSHSCGPLTASILWIPALKWQPEPVLPVLLRAQEVLMLSAVLLQL